MFFKNVIQDSRYGKLREGQYRGVKGLYAPKFLHNSNLKLKKIQQFLQVCWKKSVPNIIVEQ